MIKTTQWSRPRVYKKPDGTPYRVTVYGSGGIIATKDDPTEEDIKNFWLVASAPLLYQALYECLLFLELVEAPAILLRPVRRALAKAEGPA